MLIVGEKEVNEKLVSVRKHGMKDLGAMSVDDFVLHLKNEMESYLN